MSFHVEKIGFFISLCMRRSRVKSPALFGENKVRESIRVGRSNGKCKEVNKLFDFIYEIQKLRM